ncbi:ABC transporter substrate-binding protein [Petrotoga mexicana DSM 14811]|jgi:multiple sugar transport system substrate-binding protein|uniref:ABC transporter substrate-binding protein n=1 Tax=Petrotoga mexicana DSM 14811 TaxID=1122954 RepID=A0A2K1PCA4_9BACT|nr:extracellular solute-binding protein [Petrotoga mexicana]MDK2840318.1 multiple sugar transport system substrate-binding protein [Thermosipho sp. (in: thermotogales)]PNS00368.1 ABC transporter substrate-binding protein [Petrotoga mexicana DSM 14811]
MSKKILLMVLLVGLALLSFGKTKISVWQFMMDDTLSKQVKAQFEAANPDIELEIVQLSWATGFDRIVTSIAAGSAPDVIELGNTWLATFASQGVLRPVDDIVGKVKDDYVAWNFVEYQEKTWGFPWLLAPRAMYYNLELLDKAGLDPDNPPKTWIELLNASAKIDALGPDIYGVGLCVGELYSPYQEWFLPAVWGNMGHFVSPDLKKATLNSDPVIETANYYRSLSNYALLGKESELAEAFGQGKLGFFFAGPAYINNTQRDYPETIFDVTLIPKPRDHHGYHASFAGGEVLGISSQCENVEEAWSVIEFLLSEEVAMQITRTTGEVFPTKVGIEKDPWFESHPLHATFLEQNKYAVPFPPLAEANKIEQLFTNIVEEILLTDAQIEEILQKYNQQIQNLL